MNLSKQFLSLPLVLFFSSPYTYYYLYFLVCLVEESKNVDILIFYLALSQHWCFRVFSFHMDYPNGWHVRVQNTMKYFIAELISMRLAYFLNHEHKLHLFSNVFINFLLLM